jgi:hypothetical protein
MSSRRCLNCGLISFADGDTCRRCGLLFNTGYAAPAYPDVTPSQPGGEPPLVTGDTAPQPSGGVNTQPQAQDPRYWIWREGDTLVFHENAELPDRCVKCNALAGRIRVKKTLKWHYPAWYLLIFFGFLIPGQILTSLLHFSPGQLFAGPLARFLGKPTATSQSHARGPNPPVDYQPDYAGYLGSLLGQAFVGFVAYFLGRQIVRKRARVTIGFCRTHFVDHRILFTMAESSLIAAVLLLVATMADSSGDFGLVLPLGAATMFFTWGISGLCANEFSHVNRIRDHWVWMGRVDENYLMQFPPLK